MVAALALGGAACSDEDGDGATTDEEVGEIEERVSEGADQVEEEIDQGQEEAEN
jgi:hypothetical protein